MIRVNARLFKAASLFQAKENETTRFYLCGVSIEPHPEGALLAATDGWCLIVILDREAEARRKAIVGLPAVLQGVLTDNAADRTLRIDDAGVAVIDGHAASAGNCLIDGEFPNWRKVFQRAATQGPAAAYRGRYLGIFAEVASLLGDRDDAGVQIAPTGPEGSGLVFFPRFRDAVGVLMPVRDGLTESELTVPAWIGLTAEAE
jgi:hypothetical protein